MFSAQDVADRLEIADKIYRYCRSVDRLDVPLGQAIFTEDSKTLFPGGFEGSGQQWIEHVCRLHLAWDQHSHQVTNIIIDIDGEQAGSEAYVTATLRKQEGDRAFQREHICRYVDTWRREGGEWKIATRECVVDFNSERDVTPLIDGDRTRRDRSDPSYAAIGGI